MRFVRSGRFWLTVWLTGGAITLVWAVLTELFWLDSTRNLNQLSLFALVLAVGAGIQATLTMRKADPNDPF